MDLFSCDGALDLFTRVIMWTRESTGLTLECMPLINDRKILLGAHTRSSASMEYLHVSTRSVRKLTNNSFLIPKQNFRAKLLHKKAIAEPLPAKYVSCVCVIVSNR